MNDALIRCSCPEATHRLVLLHGWGADAEDLIPLGRELIQEVNPSFELVALRAPEEHPDGVGRQWYGLFPPDWESVPTAINALKSRLLAIATIQIPLEKTVLLGFSQGGAMAVCCGSNLPLAGLIGCSAYPHPGWCPSKKSSPLVLTHGRSDDVVPFEAAKKIKSIFKASGLDSELLEFQGGHEIPQELIPRLKLALKRWCA